MPLLFFILEHYNLLSKQPTYTCGLFSSDLMFMVVSWARAIMSISKKAWTFPGRPYYYILYFQKLIESPTTVRQKEERGIPGPQGNLEGKSCLADSFLIPVAPEGTYWAPGAAPSEEELPCRFLSLPVTLSRFARTQRLPTAIIKKSTNNQCWRECGVKGTLLHC